MKCDFSFRHYKECLELAKQTNAEIELIHDIDDSLDNSLQFAKIESELDFKATYFVRLHAKWYNALSYKSIKIIQELSQKHHIGLHFEPNFFLKENIANAIRLETQMLESICNIKVDKLSIHEPARFGSLSLNEIPINMLYYCWDSEYYSGKKYISDSGARWREGCMCNHINKHKSLIVLTHPMWWYEVYSAENY